MKNKLLLNIITIISMLFSFYAKAQLFTGTGGTILNNGQNTNFSLSVSGLIPSTLDSTFGIEEVCININHPAVEELYIYLQSPAGNIVILSEATSCNGANYTNTCFDNKAGTSVTLATAPYTGIYKPIGYLGRFNTGQSGNGTWQLIVKDYLTNANSGNVISWSILFGNSPPPPEKFTSSNLPIIIINTNNQSIGNSAIMVSMGIIDNGPGLRNNMTDIWNNYNGKTSIHIRGNSTRDFEKKSFTLQTSDVYGNQVNVPLLGMPADNDWDLVAPYQDKSLIRIPLGYTLFRQMGHYAPRFKNVEVVINNEYQGVYAFLEKPKQGKNRIAVSKITTTDNTTPTITGGYILRIDRTGSPGWYSLFPGNSNKPFFYAYEYPNSTTITSPQQVYIKAYLDSLETAMNSSSFASLTDGYPKYLEMGSFIDYFIMSELTKNIDAYRLSTYLYKDNINMGGKLHIGPVWDFGLAWHNCNYGNAFDPTGWQYQLQDSVYPTPTWWSRFLQDPNFVNGLYCRWNQLRQNILSINYLNNYIDSTANVLGESQQRNFTQWPILGTYIWPNPQNQLSATYQTEIADFKNWIVNRTTWMDANIVGICQPSGIKENNFDNGLAIYPNPASSSFITQYKINGNSKVTIELLNVMGENIIQVSDGNKVPGIYHEEIATEKLAEGIYFLKLIVDGNASYKKLIKIDKN